jgi:hypothetical protein
MARLAALSVSLSVALAISSKAPAAPALDVSGTGESAEVVISAQGSIVAPTAHRALMRQEKEAKPDDTEDEVAIGTDGVAAAGKRKWKKGRGSVAPGALESQEDEVEERQASESQDEVEERQASLSSRPWWDAGTEKEITFLNGWSAPEVNCTVMIKHGFCFLSGHAKAGNTWTDIAQLPSECRPTKRLVFNCNNHDRAARCDVGTDGKITWQQGSKKYDWLSFTGIRFATKHLAHESVLTGWGWSGYGGAYGLPTYSLHDGICSVEGMVRGENWEKIAELPRDCWPKKRLTFLTNNHEKTARLDVDPDGIISWKGGGKDHGWVSLSGILINTASELVNDLPMKTGWGPGNGPWGANTFSLNNGICTIEGVAKRLNGTSPVIATLPKACRPRKKQLIFTQVPVSRLDVLENGDIVWKAGGTPGKDGFISLSGISFDVHIQDKKLWTGPKGDQGARGKIGYRGVTGDKGPHGNKGPRGIQGEAGIPGINGTDAPDGIRGPPGSEGGPGSVGDVGQAGAPGASGHIGWRGAPGVVAEILTEVDCLWHAWTAWDMCSMSCGGGTQSRERYIRTHAQNGGKACGGMPVESRTCNTESCAESILLEGIPSSSLAEKKRTGRPEPKTETLKSGAPIPQVSLSALALSAALAATVAT